MAGTIFVFDIAVVLAVLIGVAEQDGEGGAVGPALEDAGEDLRQVFFLALGDDARLSRSAAARSGSRSSSPRGRPGGQPSMMTT